MNPTASGCERRRHPRRRLDRVSALFHGEHRLLYARLYDASRSGLAIRGPTPFAAGQVLDVRVGRVALRARVVWSNEVESAGMGLEVIEVVAGDEAYSKLVADSPPGSLSG